MNVSVLDLFVFGLGMFLIGGIVAFAILVKMVRDDENSPYPTDSTPPIYGLPQVYYADEIELSESGGGDDD